MTMVGLLGTGRMGGAMATSLARAGFPLMLYNRSPERARRLATQLGAEVGASPAAVAAATDVVISMVSDGAAVQDLYAGAEGVTAGLHAGSTAIEMSTVSPSVVRGLAAEVQARGADMIDAPVSGSVSLASTGELSIMVGGPATTLERVRPVLEALGSRVTHLGPLGSGATMKLCVNAVVFGLNQSVAEALVLAERAGVETTVAYDVLENSAIGAPYVRYKRAAFVSPAETPVAFAIELAIKDLTLIAGLASDVGASMPQALLDLALLKATAADPLDGASADLAGVAEHLRR